METSSPSSLNEFSYILIKNFEAKKIDGNLAINTLMEKIDLMKDKNDLNEILKILYSNFISFLQINKESETFKIEEYFKNMLASFNNDWNLMEKKLMDMLSSIKIYSEKEEKKCRKKLSKVI